MFRKFLIITSLLIVISGCSLWKKENVDFSSLYTASIDAHMDRLKELVEGLGYQRDEEVSGNITGSLEIPVFMSGAFSSRYSLGVYKNDVLLTLEDVISRFESMVSPSTFDAKKISLLTSNGDLFMLYDGLKTSLLPEEAINILSKYNNKWLSYTEEDMEQALSGASMEEQLSATISKNLSEMTLADIREYLHNYPFLKSEGEGVSTGSKITFPVSLDKNMLIDLMSKVSQDITGSGFTADEKTSMVESMATLMMTGNIVFDHEDTKFLSLQLNIVESGSEIGEIRIENKRDKAEIHVTSFEETSEIIILAEKQDTTYSYSLTLKQEGIERGQVKGVFVLDGKSLQKMNIDFMAEGVSVSLEHTNNRPEKTYEGRLMLPVGTISWNGSTDGGRITSLILKGAMPAGSIDMNLREMESKLQGPLIVRNGSEEMMKANIALLLQEGKFGFDVDIENTLSSGSALKASIALDYVKNKLKEKFEIPQDTLSFDALSKELEQLLPTEDAVLSEESDFGDIENISDDSLPLLPSNQ